MESVAGFATTGRRLVGPGADLIELTSDNGLRHTAVVFHPEVRDHDSLNSALDVVRSYLESPMVTGMVELVEHDRDEGAFVYPTGQVWSVAEVIRNLADAGETAGIRAGLELLYAAGQILVEAADVGAGAGVYSHGGLTPWRVMLKKDGQVLIIGYGLPQAEILQFSEDPNRVPREDSFRYCPPERTAAAAEDLSSDLFSLALVAFELMTGKPVYDGLVNDIRQQAGRGEGSRRLFRFKDLLPPSVRDLLGRAMKPSPQDRFESGDHFMEDVRAVLSGPDSVGLSLMDLMARVAQQGPRSGKALQGGKTQMLSKDDIARMLDGDAPAASSDGAAGRSAGRAWSPPPDRGAPPPSSPSAASPAPTRAPPSLGPSATSPAPSRAAPAPAAEEAPADDDNPLQRWSKSARRPRRAGEPEEAAAPAPAAAPPAPAAAPGPTRASFTPGRSSRNAPGAVPDPGPTLAPDVSTASAPPARSALLETSGNKAADLLARIRASAEDLSASGSRARDEGRRDAANRVQEILAASSNRRGGVAEQVREERERIERDAAPSAAATQDAGADAPRFAPGRARTPPGRRSPDEADADVGPVPPAAPAVAPPAPAQPQAEAAAAPPAANTTQPPVAPAPRVVDAPVAAAPASPAAAPQSDAPGAHEASVAPQQAPPAASAPPAAPTSRAPASPGPASPRPAVLAPAVAPHPAHSGPAVLAAVPAVLAAAVPAAAEQVVGGAGFAGATLDRAPDSIASGAGKAGSASFTLQRGASGRSLRMRLPLGANAAEAVSWLIGNVLPVRTDLQGRVSGWYRLEVDGNRLAPGTLLSDLDPERPLVLVTVPNLVVMADVEVVGGTAPVRLVTPVGTAVPVASLVDHLTAWLALPAASWRLSLDGVALDAHGILADLGDLPALVHLRLDRDGAAG
jgi:hypothetical protein